ncbi:MAG TPA: ABC transporter permease [Nocardioidaceae bacterium]|nr:ABC transporter permease [Nocardioidaceae bacterium]
MLKRAAVGALAPMLALVIAVLITVVILLLSGDSVSGFLSTLFSAPAPRNLVNILNNSSVLYLSALAAAIGFRMNLFNIGVEGQYRVAVFAAAAFLGQDLLPGALNIVVAFALAIAAGAAWAAIAGLLKVTRGVSEVISTIMLNAIAVSLTAYLLRRWGLTVGNSLQTKPVPEDSWVPGLDLVPEAPNEILGLSLLAVVAGLAYSVVLNRTRFGFELRATGASSTAAVASGIDVRRMVVVSMVISGGVAALVGLPFLFGDTHAYSTTFQSGLGFSGLAVALLGRNHPVGIAFGALLFAYLTEQSSLLEINAGVSNDIISITQGVLVLSVVVAYEVVRRYRRAAEQRAVAEQLAPGRPGTGVSA